MSDIDLVYAAKVLGTTNFKVIDGDTGIIMYDPNRKMQRRLQRTVENPSKKGKRSEIRNVSIIRSFDTANHIASNDALSVSERRQLSKGNPGRIIKKASF